MLSCAEFWGRRPRATPSGRGRRPLNRSTSGSPGEAPGRPAKAPGVPAVLPIDEGKYDALMMSAEYARTLGSGSDVAPFVAANSMREVQPEIGTSPSARSRTTWSTSSHPARRGWEFPPAQEATS